MKKKDLKSKITEQVFDEYFKDGEMVEFATLKALWASIDEKVMKYKANTIKGGYSAFLNTIYWKTVAEEAKRRAGYRCQLCNSDKSLNVHHRCYDNRGNEVLHMEDLICLCHDCHEHHHKGRERIADLEWENTLMKHYEMMSKTYSERIKELEIQYEMLENQYEELKRAKLFVLDDVPSDKAREYFGKMKEDELRKNCIQLYDTFTALRNYAVENAELTARLSLIKRKLMKMFKKKEPEKWQRPEWFDNPPEDEITCF